MNLAVFDVDGTLLDNLASEDETFARALREELALDELDTNWDHYEHVSDDGVTFEAYRRMNGVDPTSAQLVATVERFVGLLRESLASKGATRRIAGVDRLFEDLARRGWAVALATGAWRAAAHLKLEAAGISFAGVPLATSEDGPARTDIVTQAITRARALHGNVVFARTVSIGDGVWDVQTAHRLQLPFVGVATGGCAERLVARGATHTIPDYSDTARWLAALDAAEVPRRTASWA